MIGVAVGMGLLGLASGAIAALPSGARARRHGLVFVLVLPIAIYTFLFAAQGSLSGDALNWWAVGLIMISPALLAWWLMAGGGFLMMRRTLP